MAYRGTGVIYLGIELTESKGDVSNSLSSTPELKSYLSYNSNLVSTEEYHNFSFEQLSAICHYLWSLIESYKYNKYILTIYFVVMTWQVPLNIFTSLQEVYIVIVNQFNTVVKYCKSGIFHPLDCPSNGYSIVPVESN